MCDTVQRLVEFREALYNTFFYRADATMDLIDAMASNSSARSPVELSLSSLFPRQYSSLHDAVDNFFIPSNTVKVQEERQEHQRIRMRIVAEQLPEPTGRNFYLFGLDTTGQPRPFAKAVADRGIHYHPNPAPGNKPIIAGHSYSVLAALPEKTQRSSLPWVLPLLIQRVPTDKKAIEIGAGQVADVLKDEKVPFGRELCALVGDSSYGVCEFVGRTVEHKNLITIVRVRGNRTFYRIAEQGDVSNGKGHPTWYGTSFDMKDSTTWGEADAIETVSFTLRNGRVCQVQIRVWYNLLMRGKRGIPMHTHPFTLIRITVEDSDGKLVFKRPLWLIVIGDRRREVSLTDAYHAYRQRYDLEHFFRFGKQKLLMSSYQTPDVEHEQNWWEIVGLAYAQLYVSAPLAQNFPRPWERYLPEFKKPNAEELSSPSMVQRDLPRIIREIGTPALLPKPRGKSSGRIKGYSPGKRERFPLIIKGTHRARKYPRAP